MLTLSVVQRTDAHLWNLAAQLAREWQREAMRSWPGKFCIAYNVSPDYAKAYSMLRVQPIDAPADAVWKHGTDIGTNWTYDQATRAIAEAMRRWPILPPPEYAACDCAWKPDTHKQADCDRARAKKTARVT
jgi:hypothetical protein